MNRDKGPIAYMASNHVAANMLMLVLVIGGLVIGSSIKQEVFPETELDMVLVSVAYPGATPAEVEEAVVRPVELAISGVDDVKKVTSSANESVGTITVEVLENGDVDMVLQDVKTQIDRIRTFPEEAERPVISKVIPTRQVLSLIIFGDVPERSLREIADQVKDDLLAKENITQVTLSGAREYEISIEIPEDNLRKYGLTLPTVASIVSQASLDMAGGTIKDESGEVLIRITEKRYTGTEFDSVKVFTMPDGREVLLKDIGVVKDSFEENDMEVLFDGKPSIMVQVFRVGEQTPKEVSQTVKDYVASIEGRYPPTVQFEIYNDSSEVLQSRIDLLLNNGMLGLILVVVILSMFLEIRLAVFVAMGIVISFLGAMLFMPSLDVSINMMSLFAFLIILGIVVDDAIVVGENVLVHRRMGKSLLRASIDGTREMSMAVVFAGLTTIAAFAPLLFVGGFFGKFLGVVPVIIITVLIISLVESIFILPAHLNGWPITSKAPVWDKIENQRKRFDGFIGWLIDKTYVDSLKWSTRNRYITVAIAIAVMLITFGMFAGGFIKFSFMPSIEADEVVVTLEMPPGTTFLETKKLAEEIEAIGRDLVAKSDAERGDGLSNLEHVFTIVGQSFSGGGHRGGSNTTSSNLAQIRLLLTDPDVRTISSPVLASKWREAVGDVPGVERLQFRSDLINSSADMEVQLSHTDFDVLLAASERLKSMLSEYAGMQEVDDSYTEGKRELKLKLRPEAASLGITEASLAQQVRGAFYGSEVARIQRGENEVKVMVRYPEEDRRTLMSIEKMRIRTASGEEIPFKQAAYIDEGRGYSTIQRTDRRRVVSVTASVDKRTANVDDIMADLESTMLPKLLSYYPGLAYSFEGRSLDQKESLQSILRAEGFGLFLIFALLAIPFRSFFQPLIVMSAIPFGVIGAAIGHLLLGYPITMISMWGIVALTGVVVNSSLVMIDFINRGRADGMDVVEAVHESGRRRFRPIIMTSLTTFFGLIPIILETSIQAQFLIPMAISLGFGVLFSTAITLVLIPSLYLILEDILNLWRAIFGMEVEEIKTDPAQVSIQSGGGQIE